MSRHTPLHDRHVALGARMVDFAGYDMPLQYTGIREEHVAVRERAGMFDVSHMGEVRFSGPGALDAVQRLVANDCSRLEPAQALYGVMCNEQGGIVDDVIVSRGLNGKHFIVVVNAATREKDVAWMRDHLAADAEMEDVSDATALIAVQGPAAVGIVQSLTDTDLSTLGSFHITGAQLAGISDSSVSVVSRTGYTGEDGVELYIDPARAGQLWDAVLEAGRPLGLLPCGLAARDTLRLEAGLRLYGQDMDETVDPLSCGLGWTVKLGKDDFVGAQTLRRLREEGPPRTLLGLALEGRAIARHGQAVFVDGRRVGEVTSGTFSFSLGHGIATALVEADAPDAPTVDVDIRGTSTPARVVPMPFYRRRKA
jgi:glycine cleavage system T protein (aminomethyltransferase)